VFNVVNALLVRSLPFRDPDRLIATHSFLPPNRRRAAGRICAPTDRSKKDQARRVAGELES
jgi:hypothetical protein